MQKYKVFLNEKRLIFVPGTNITLSKPSRDFIENCLNKGNDAWLQKFVRSNISETVVEHPDVESLFRKFKMAFLQVNAAGGVVRRGDEILFILRNGKWDLPKGKIDCGETSEKAALREVEEECGISGHSIVRALPPTYHVYQSPYKETMGQWIFKETIWYEMDYKGLKNGNPQLNEGITSVRWFKRSELNEILENTYENLKALIQLYLA